MIGFSGSVRASRVTSGAEYGDAGFKAGGRSDSTSACRTSDAMSAATSGRWRSAAMQRTPDLRRGERHVEVQQAERIEHGMNDRRGGADGAELAAAFHAEQVRLARQALVEARTHRRQIGGARHRIIH